jgi:excisionase family DNA binding protein
MSIAVLPQAEPANQTKSALLTKTEVAALLKVSARYVERQVRSARLRALKLSHKITRFRRRDVEVFLASAATFFVTESGVTK